MLCQGIREGDEVLLSDKSGEVYKKLRICEKNFVDFSAEGRILGYKNAGVQQTP
jgi:hypothetical protein